MEKPKCKTCKDQGARIKELEEELEKCRKALQSIRVSSLDSLDRIARCQIK